MPPSKPHFERLSTKHPYNTLTPPTPPKHLQCAKCDAAFSTPRDRKVHLELEKCCPTSGTGFCGPCGHHLVPRRNWDVVEHLASDAHIDRSRHAGTFCDVCEWAFFSVSELGLHCADVHGTGRWVGGAWVEEPRRVSRPGCRDRRELAMFRCCGCEERVSGHKKLLRHLLVCAAVKLEEVFEEKTIYENRDLENMNIWKWRVWEVELRAHKRKIKDDKAKEKTRRKKIFQPQKWVGVVTYPKTAGR